MPTSWLMILLSTPLALASRLAADALMANPSSSEKALPRAPTHAALEAIEFPVRGQMQKETAKNNANPSSGTALLDSGANSAAHMEVAESSFHNLGPNSLVSEASLGDKSRLHKHDASTIAVSQVEARKGAEIAGPGCPDWCVQCKEDGVANDQTRVFVERAVVKFGSCTAQVQCGKGKSGKGALKQAWDQELSKKTNSVLLGVAVEERQTAASWYEDSYSKATLKTALEAHFKKLKVAPAVIHEHIDGEVDNVWQNAIPTPLGKRLNAIHREWLMPDIEWRMVNAEEWLKVNAIPPRKKSVEATQWEPLWGELCNACGFEKMSEEMLGTALTDSLEPTDPAFPFHEKCMGK